MAYYYKIDREEIPHDGIQVHQNDVSSPSNGPSTTFDFSKHVLIELLDDITPETKLWEELGLNNNKHVRHKRMMVDSHRVHCRRAIVVCSNADEAKKLAERVSQTKIMRRSVCAVVVHELLSDISLFEKQILRFGDSRPQEQLLFVTDLNRCRDSATLAEYLQEMFSPFGSILSIFVAQDKDGFAFPEGVIKFAHLSEAFAAELAYDQYVVGMERLSVTTHHNILLSQCDLRVRLREAHLRHNQSNNSTHSFRLSEPRENFDPDRTFNLSTVHENNTTEYSTLVQNNSQCDISEIADVLQNSCENNLIECLKGITMASDTTKDSIEENFSEEIDITPQKSMDITNNSLHPTNGTWASRITNWIEGVSNAEFSQNIPSNHSTPISKTDQHSVEGNSKCPLKVTSTVGSFVTCHEDTNDGLTSASISDKDNENSVLSNGNTTIVNGSSSPDSFHSADGILSIEQNSDNGINCTSVKVASPTHSSTMSTSQKRKNYNPLSNKLSLKSQRLDSFSQSSITDVTQPVDVEETLEVTRCLPKHLKSPVISIKKLSSRELRNLGCNISLPNVINGNGFDEKSRSSNGSSVNSLPTRRSSRISFRKSSLKPGRKESSVTVSENRNDIPLETPLRVWLRKELTYSSNNRVNGNLEKKIVCAAVRKDLLVSVGCSHMTCDYCYPGSTNLLLGLD